MKLRGNWVSSRTAMRLLTQFAEAASMAPRFSLDRFRHLDSAVHARELLTMREQFGLTPNTLDAYARAIDSYYFFLESRERTCETSNQGGVASWISELRARGLANATLIQRVTAVRCFLSTWWRKGCARQSSVPRRRLSLLSVNGLRNGWTGQKTSRTALDPNRQRLGTASSRYS